MRIQNCLYVLLLLLVRCKDQPSQPLPPNPYEQWLSHSIHNYTVTQVLSCFCANGGVAMRITVRSDTIALVNRLSDSVEIPRSQWIAYSTIEDLFAIIRFGPKTDSLVVTYNSQFGYPERLDVNPQLHPVDGGVLYETSSLQIP